MKIFVVVFCACAILALAEGRTRVTRDAVVVEAGEAEHHTTEGDIHDCDQHADHYYDLKDRFMGKAMDCMDGVMHLNNLTELEEYRQFFSGYCSRLPKVKKCLEGIEEKAQHCLNATQQNAIRIFLGFMWSVVDTGCANQGEPLATIGHGFEAQDDQETPILVQCINEVDFTTEHTTGPMSFYHKLHELKDCLIGKIKVGGKELKTAVRSLMDDVIRDLQCVDPEHNTLVLCSSVASD